ncbi:unnamed protein product [Cuscuta europaea]|uniref:Prolamin-like domain-containing protein n=1 Tax=Cuscuta europaea TaxID=41803 RepID=A0A9P0ZGS0_CUSEU|nr:unnamed protein product [Cuscuta europaea]
MAREMKMPSLNISWVLLLGLLLSGKTRLSSCSDVLQCSKPEPTDECWKLMVQYIQDDGNEGRVFPPKDPFPSCCPEVRNLGEECFWYWVDHENGKIGYGRYDVEVIFFQTSNAWTLCHQML